MRPSIEEVVAQIESVPIVGRRRLVALAGPPASGKSTFATKLCRKLDNACLVPMDGFHLDNSILEQRGDLMRKGAPYTFDAAGFVHLVQRVKTEEDVVFPKFNRELDKSIAGAGVVHAATKTVVFEGNYLLLNTPEWRELEDVWDVTVALSVPKDVLKSRLIARWIKHGYSQNDALAKAEGNDLKNAEFVMQHGRSADIVINNY